MTNPARGFDQGNVSAEHGDETVDVVVVGSGNGGLTAAITAAHLGLRTVVLEKAERFGGSSSLSGGAVWIPNNPVNQRAGVRDSLEAAERYLEAMSGDVVSAERRTAYLTAGPEMLAFLEGVSRHVRFGYSPGYADYHPEAPGGAPLGRSISPLAIDAHALGPLEAELNESDALRPPGGIWLRPTEYRDLLLVARTWKGRKTALAVGARAALARILRRRMVSGGAAGVVRLRLALRDQGVPLRLATPLRSLVLEEGRVVGVEVERDGRPVRILARRGVVLAAGGFERNDDMRRQYHPQPSDARWSSGAASNTGDAIRAAMEVGAGVELMDRAWWGPSMLAGDRAIFILAERSLPGSIMVDQAGQRFVNESAPYVTVVDEIYAKHEEPSPTIPSVLVFDQGFRDRYPFIKVPPRAKLPEAWVANGWVTMAPTIHALADSLGLPPEGLVSTVARFNDLAAAGRDLDFGRGDSAYDRYYADPTIGPNPNLAPLVKPPFYAVRLVPGDLGTSGGLRTDEHARVLREDGTPIEGLYATGNCTASVMGREYAGPGATIGPAMTFGYIAARHLVGGAQSRGVPVVTRT